MSFLKDFDHLKIQIEDIVSATNNFDPTKVIGSGGFGKVYKGELSSREGQITVAFKQLDCRLGQGNIEFWKEVMTLSKYKHENIISLVHYCIEGDDMILVYEYAAHGSLDRYLDDANTLTWIRRLKICIGAARGIHFLHDPKETQQRVLHRDIKSSNILLDESWTAKVSDFGLSKVGPANQAHTFLISHCVGTPGYCDPLYMELGFLSKESDVYSFGVVLFEILCGRLCFEYHNRELTKILVPKWRGCYDEKKLDEIVLPGLREQMDPGSLKSFSAIAYQCVKRVREERPTMAEIVEVLEFSLEQQEIFENTPESSHKVITTMMLSGQMEQSRRLDDIFVDWVSDDYFQPSTVSERDDIKDGPGIDELQILGDATLGGILIDSGYSVRGTSTSTFQAELGLSCGQEIGNVPSVGLSGAPSDHISSPILKRVARSVSPPMRQDDKDGHCVFTVGDDLTTRYKIHGKMGEGTSAQVLECWDKERKEMVAIKIVHGIKKYREAAMTEIDILQQLGKHDKGGNLCVQIRNWFDYHKHICIVFEKLGPSLYDFQRKNNYRSFPMDIVFEIARQLLECIAYMHDLQLIHTDLKLENVLLVSAEYIKVPDYKGSSKDTSFSTRLPRSSAIKVIDFGSTTYDRQDQNYIVSTRHYRAPEIILGLGWSYPCDI